MVALKMPSALHSNGLAKYWWANIATNIRARLGTHHTVILATALVMVLQITFLIIVTLAPQCAAPHNTIPANTRDLPTIYIVTPTYARPVQRAELTRLAQTLMQVPKIHWLIVEDSTSSTGLLQRFVSRLGMRYNFSSVTLLHEPTPERYKRRPGDPEWKYPKGSWQRNKALEWLRMQNLPGTRNVVYFADDDNTYDLELFDEMRFTSGVAVWPVGLVGGLLVERPLVDKSSSRVYGFNSRWAPNRKFPMDMAGFAVNLDLLLSNPEVTFSCNEQIGHMESAFLDRIVPSISDLEPRAQDCSKVLVWHTQTKSPSLYLDRKQKRTSYVDLDI